jgi:uncharacterized protein
MIQHSFCFLPGIGDRLEKRLWKSGILTWDAFLSADEVDFLSACNKRRYNDMLREARQNMEQLNTSYFARNLKHSEHWRLFQLLRGSAVSLDIETSGGTAHNGGCVTVVGLYDGFDYTALVQGINLTGAKLAAELSRYRYIITFYGTAFDLPYLRAAYGLSIDLPHFDLCFSGRKAGLRGGLKRVEELLGIHRDNSVRDFDGFSAVRLWQEAKQGSRDALELLITYNRCDTVNLFDLAAVIYERLMARTGITEFLLRQGNSTKPDTGSAHGT